MSSIGEFASMTGLSVKVLRALRDAGVPLPALAVALRDGDTGRADQGGGGKSRVC
jgi:DNA-binding transcriptional MerR regulator